MSEKTKIELIPENKWQEANHGEIIEFNDVAIVDNIGAIYSMVDSCGDPEVPQNIRLVFQKTEWEPFVSRNIGKKDLYEGCHIIIHNVIVNATGCSPKERYNYSNVIVEYEVK